MSTTKGSGPDAAQDLAGTAKEEARQVTDEATGQIKSLASSAQDELSSQASTQQRRIAEQSRTITDDLQRISRGEQPESDLVSRFVNMAAERAEQFTTQLENKEPADLLKDVRRFAARRPGAFLAIAAGVGLAAGRLTRGLTDNDDEQQSGGGQSSRGNNAASAPPVQQTTPSEGAGIGQQRSYPAPENTPTASLDEGVYQPMPDSVRDPAFDGRLGDVEGIDREERR